MVIVAMAVPDKHKSSGLVPSVEQHLPRKIAHRSSTEKPQKSRRSHFTPEEPFFFLLCVL
jgi:hypothetical protein